VREREDLAELRETGLERTEALAKDIVWLAGTCGRLIPEVSLGIIRHYHWGYSETATAASFDPGGRDRP
jgi:hypothetical protein